MKLSNNLIQVTMSQKEYLEYINTKQEVDILIKLRGYLVRLLDAYERDAHNHPLGYRDVIGLLNKILLYTEDGNNETRKTKT